MGIITNANEFSVNVQRVVSANSFRNHSAGRLLLTVTDCDGNVIYTQMFNKIATLINEATKWVTPVKTHIGNIPDGGVFFTNNNGEVGIFKIEKTDDYTIIGDIAYGQGCFINTCGYDENRTVLYL